MPQNKTNPYTPDLGQANTPTYIRPGIADPNKAGIIAGAAAGLIPGAMNMYEDYRISEDVMKPIDEALETYEGAQGAREAVIGGAAAIDTTWDQLGQIPQDTTGMSGLGKESEKLDLLEKSVADNTQKFIKAKEQGLITESDMLARITKITREAVTKNPWMEDRYYNAATKYLKQSGIGDVLEYRQKAAADKATAQDAYRKGLITELKERNLNYDPSMSTEHMQAIANEQRLKDRRLQDTKNVLEGQVKLDELNIRKFVSNGGAYVGHNLDIEQLQKDAQTMYAAAGENGAEVIKVNMYLQQQYANKMRQWRTALGSEAITDQGKTLLETIDKDYSSMLSGLKDVASGKEAAEYLKNHLEALTSAQKLNLRQNYNVEDLELATKLYAVMPDGIKAQALQRDAADPLNQMLNQADKLMAGSIIVANPTGSSTKAVQTVATNGALVNVFQGVAEAPDGKFGLDTKQGLGRAMFAINHALSTGMSDSDSYGLAYQTLEAAAKNSEKIRSQGQTTEYGRQATQLVSFSMNKLGPDVVNTANRVIKESGIPVEFDVLPNGSFIIKTGDMELDNKFAEKFGKHINNAIDTYASSMGKSRSEVAAEFYPAYFGRILVNDPDVMNSSSTAITPPGEFKVQSGTTKVPRGEEGPSKTGNMRSVDDVLKAYNRGAINEKEYSALIKFFQGD